MFKPADAAPTKLPPKLNVNSSASVSSLIGSSTLLSPSSVRHITEYNTPSRTQATDCLKVKQMEERILVSIKPTALFAEKGSSSALVCMYVCLFLYTTLPSSIRT